MSREDRDELVAADVETSGSSSSDEKQRQSQAHERAGARYQMPPSPLKLVDPCSRRSADLNPWWRVVEAASLTSMAHRPVEELRVHIAGGSPGALVRVDATPPARKGDLRSWVERSPLPPGGMMLGGVGLALVGLGLGLALPLTMGTATLFGGMVTFGGGVAFLGGLKRKVQVEAAKALPPAPIVSPVVLNERTRRVRDWLQSRGQATFEEIAQALKWTEAALVETLLHMKETGALEEDLDLDSGQWVYRMQAATDTGTAASLMLSERARGR